MNIKIYILTRVDVAVDVVGTKTCRHVAHMYSWVRACVISEKTPF